jgi:hypothetical protein
MSTYHTHLAAEFHVLSMLSRCGWDASLSLGHKKTVDIVVVLPSAQMATIDVKGVAGPHDWPCDNLTFPAPAHHFIVLVSFEGKMTNLRTVPAVWVVPANEIMPFITSDDMRHVIVRSRIRTHGKPYWQAWSRMMEGRLPAVPRPHDPPRRTEVLRRWVKGLAHACWRDD